MFSEHEHLFLKQTRPDFTPHISEFEQFELIPRRCSKRSFFLGENWFYSPFFFQYLPHLFPLKYKSSLQRHFLFIQTSPNFELQICKGEEPQSLLNSLETI